MMERTNQFILATPAVSWYPVVTKRLLLRTLH